ncbi:PVC-type heme-binding CxxCH protein [Tuwongella immobilis]|uniref:Cytochrome c domain-containing protein n=1 Tax=Tuwongella immobilis TaxID=692036 RepID=A0A6C2YQH1_9BACT|nr:PVC-type heme-binding CxxCH protein [Tuwongella immobilis]VIP03409.1 heme-binding protein : Heme-binding protein OS=Planctomyces brasiliensis (strain ATCC 49424 / DSM 5305 / JCM 21570 / NBRC 103401 / IFAM 1448) GN=Plabr_4793 PE=4 SV=1: GSDH: HEAT_2: Cytochrom_C [Tuwongella immobilis]VTS04190.1 heme-binding protein : Heme-binding protein OS=Planctomyces brasiliensis (strain ATCC 49424 / DSM 5305 / JCM 21570 / NBRC 103401 / IFAM 1448) GN=Plabr_4793 PE=4 SV=1: GSDH: HEAT_2: Cytochrom_C [Tuwongell
MFRTLSALLSVVWMTSLAMAAEKVSIDIVQPQSPPKPAPEGLELVDQGKFDPKFKGYFLPDGFRMELVASEPTIINPVGMTFDTNGTLYVLEWLPHTGAGFPEFKETFTYKDGSKKVIATMKKQVKDVVKVLRFNAEKGIYDKFEIVGHDELPSSILVHDGWIYLSGRGTVRRYKQSKADGPFDVKEVIAQGFCGYHHHQVSGMTIGNDGWLYLTSGDDDNFAEGSDGSRATVLRTGAVFRCKPDGSQLHVYSIGYRNPYRDLAFDDKMNWFHVDNDNEDGSKFTGCRIMHVVEGADFGWRLFPGARCCKPDHLRGAVYGEMPGKMPPMLKTGRGSPAGLMIYNDTRIPEAYRGWLYYPDVFRKVVRAYQVSATGSTFEIVKEFEFFKSAEPLFRPCQMITGPDGAIYVCDWRTDSGGAGKLWGDNVHGAIYRIRWVGGKPIGSEEVEPEIPLRGMDSWAKIVRGSDAELLAALELPDQTDRLVAQAELRKRGEKNRDALLQLLANREKLAVTRIAVVGVLQSMWNDAVRDAFVAALNDIAPDVRRLAADGLALNAKPGDPLVTSALTKAVTDAAPAVRRSVAIALGKIGGASEAGALVNLYKFDDGQDVFLHDGLLRAIEATGKAGMQELVILLNSGDAAMAAKVVAAFQATRTMAAAEAIPKVLANPHLNDEQRAAIIRSYPNYLFDPPLSMDPLVEYLTANPDLPLTVQLAGLDVLAQTGGLSGQKIATYLTTLLDSDEADLRRVAIQTIETSRVTAASGTLVKYVADKNRLLAERLAMVQALRVLNDQAAVPVMEQLLVGDPKSPTPLPLLLESLRTLAALNPARGSAAATKLLDQSNPMILNEVIPILGANATGAKLVGQRYLDGKLPTDTIGVVSDALRKHDRDPEAANLMTAVMRNGLKLSLQPAEVEKMRRLVATKGNAMRGREIFLNAKSLQCIHCHKLEGIGGQIGPDLTRVWDTHTLEKIMESIIEPSKEIKEGYQTYTVETTKGQIFSGLKIVDMPKEILIREATGKDIRIPRDDIEEMKLSKTSLMPDNATSQLTYDQFIDLLAFLKSKDAQESLRGLALEFHVVGPFPNDQQTTFPPETNLDRKATYPGLPGQSVTWRTLQTRADGFLDLEPIFQGKDRVSAYALTYVYSPKAQKVPLLLGSDDMIRVWVNGKLVHEYLAERSAVPDADRVEIELKEGWNPVLSRVINRLGGSGMYLRIAGGDGLRFALEPK